MKFVLKTIVPCLLCLTHSMVYAQEAQTILPANANVQSVNQDTVPPYYRVRNNNKTQDIAKYLLNLGLYMGFNLNQKPSAKIETTLIDATQTQIREVYSLNSFLGARMVNAISSALASFAPNTFPIANSLNLFANYTYKSQPYNSPQARKQGKIAASTLVDQPAKSNIGGAAAEGSAKYQNDPVNQSILNILGTPDTTYCMNYQGTKYQKNCAFLTNYKVVNNLIGDLPQTFKFFDYSYNQNLLSQLNSNSLLGPLAYTTEGTNQQQGASGLTASNQAQNAANFIRYASGTVLPPNLPKRKDYDDLYQKAKNTNGNYSIEVQKQAQATLSNYLANLRVYAAQASVGMSNLYSILSKRMVQNFGSGASSDASTKTSQALSEFKMATWRLYNLQGSGGGNQQNKEWINKINAASSETVQKEIAVLLAEINYQLYLSRQQQERILLTNTVMMLQNAKSAEPIPSLGTTSDIKFEQQ